MPLPPGIIVALFLLAALGGAWDLGTRRIPNWLTLAGLIAGFVLNGVLYGLAGLELAGIGMLTGFGIYLVLYLLHAMGAGDVKFMAAVGSLVGWRWWFHIFFVSVIIGAVAGVILALSRGRLRSTFGNVGYIVSEIAHFRPPHLKREDLDVKSEKALCLPHGAAIAAGIFIVVGLDLVESVTALDLIRQHLRDLGIDFREVHHAPTFTSEESAKARGEDLRIGGKALLMKTGDVFRLFVLSASLKADSAAIREKFGVKKTRFATPAELLDLTGLVPGSVPPFGPPILPFELYADPSITANEKIAFNAGSLEDSIILRVEDWLRAARPEVFLFALR